MDDLISRMAAIGCLGNSPEQMCMPWSEVERMLRELPAVDAAPVVHARWVKVPGFVTPGGDPVWRCSKCGKGQHVYGVEHGSYGVDVSDGQWVACPNCGAKMNEYAPACGPDYCEI